MSDDLVKRARDAIDGATPGPWHTSPDGWRVTDKRVTFDDDGSRCGETPNICIFAETKANAIFIAASRELVPAMAAHIEKLEDTIAVLDASVSRVYTSAQWAAFNKVLGWINTQETKLIAKGDLYDAVMEMRPDAYALPIKEKDDE